MKTICDNCGETNKGRYTTFFIELEEKNDEGEHKKKLVTWCHECKKGPAGKTDKQNYEHIATPYWVHAGQKPNAQDKNKLAYMKAKNMTWGDLKMERDMAQAKSDGGMKAFLAHKKTGGGSAKPFNKRS